MLYVLIVIEIVFLLCAFFLFEKDIIAPPVITLLVILIGTIFVIPSVELWRVKISAWTICTVLIGCICIIFASFCAKIHKKGRCYDLEKYVLCPIHCYTYKEIILAIFTLLFTFLYLIDAIRVGSYYGGSGFGAIGYMKAAYAAGNMTVKMNIFIRQGFKFVIALAYISAFAVANNIFVLHEKVKKNICYIVMLLCGCAITIFSGSRTEILRILSALLFCYSVLSRMNLSWKLKTNFKSVKSMIKKFMPLIIVVIILAFTSRAAVKTKGTGGSEIVSVLGYISYYIGSPIQVLNEKLNYFSNIWELVFGTNNEIPEFVYLGKLGYGGNVSTVFGSCITYNGLIGMIMYLFIVYYIGTMIYYKIYRQKSTWVGRLKIVVFSYVYYVFTMSYYSVCTIELIQFSNMAILVIIMILFKGIVKREASKKFPGRINYNDTRY